MIKRLFLVVASVLICISCSPPPPPAILPPALHRGVQHRNVPSFSAIRVQGNVNVRLYTGSKKSQVILRGDPRDLVYVTTAVSYDRLQVNLGKGYPHYGRVEVAIYTRYLTDFTYRGVGSIYGSHLRSESLNISIDNPGKTSLEGTLAVRNLELMGSGFTQMNGITSQSLRVTLKGSPRVKLVGMANLRALDLEGQGWLSMYWVKSRYLEVKARDKASIQLAGVADKFEVELWGGAQFHGKYLRANRVFAKTHDHALAEITALHRQSTLASDASNIYFYEIPDLRTDFMAFSGSVLDMREYSPFMQEYTAYNK